MEQILDYSEQEVAGEQYVKINLASAGQRFANLLIDSVISFILVFAYAFILGMTAGFAALEGPLYLTAYLIAPIYFIVMESATGKSIGKMITGTRVVTEEGGKPSLGQYVGRAFARYIPFEAFSFLGSKAVGWHDSLTSTRVISDKK